jgi:hypothetical protein
MQNVSNKKYFKITTCIGLRIDTHNWTFKSRGLQVCKAQGLTSDSHNSFLPKLGNIV